MVVVVSTVVGSLFWLPQAYWKDTIRHAWASLGFWENWQLIASSADYLQQDQDASPFQQFWALAANLQFYLLFASFVLLLVVLVRWRTGALTGPGAGGSWADLVFHGAGGAAGSCVGAVLWVADASFAFYLRHWPLLVFYRHQSDEQVDLAAGLAIIGVSLVLAVITTKLIEDPIRKSRWLSGRPWVARTRLSGLLPYWRGPRRPARTSFPTP